MSSPSTTSYTTVDQANKKSSVATSAGTSSYSNNAHYASIIYYLAMVVILVCWASIAYNQNTINRGLDMLKLISNPDWRINPGSEPMYARWGINLLTVMMYIIVLFIMINAIRYLFPANTIVASVALFVTLVPVALGCVALSRVTLDHDFTHKFGMPANYNDVAVTGANTWFGAYNLGGVETPFMPGQGVGAQTVGPAATLQYGFATASAAPIGAPIGNRELSDAILTRTHILGIGAIRDGSVFEGFDGAAASDRLRHLRYGLWAITIPVLLFALATLFATIYSWWRGTTMVATTGMFNLSPKYTHLAVAAFSALVLIMSLISCYAYHKVSGISAI